MKKSLQKHAAGIIVTILLFLGIYACDEGVLDETLIL